MIIKLDVVVKENNKLIVIEIKGIIFVKFVYYLDLYF